MSGDHWMQFYNNAASSGAAAAPILYGGDSTAVTTANQTQTSASLSPESGRVTKPARKRSRASRRTPTTLLNTDKSNFRAMVQQFTGGPAFGSGTGPNNPNLMAFGLGLARPMMGPSGGGYQLQYQPQQQQQQQYHQQSYSNVVYSGPGQDPMNTGGLIQRLMMEGQGQGDGASSAAARPASGGSNENTSYLF